MRKLALILLLFSCSALCAEDVHDISEKLNFLKGFHDFGWLEKREIVVDKLLNDGYVIEQSKDSVAFTGEHLGYSCVFLFEFSLDNFIKAYVIIDSDENRYREIVIKVSEQYGHPANIRDDGRLRTWTIPYGNIDGMITALLNEKSTVMLYNLHFKLEEEASEE